MGVLERDFARLFLSGHNKLYSLGDLPLTGGGLSVGGAYLLLRRQRLSLSDKHAAMSLHDVHACQRMILPWGSQPGSGFISAWNDLLQSVAEAWTCRGMEWNSGQMTLSKREVEDITLLAHIPALVNFIQSERAWWSLRPEKRTDVFCGILAAISKPESGGPALLNDDWKDWLDAFSRSCCQWWCDALVESLAQKYGHNGRLALLPETVLDAEGERFLLENEVKTRIKRSDLVGWHENGKLIILCLFSDPDDINVVYNRLNQHKWSTKVRLLLL